MDRPIDLVPLVCPKCNTSVPAQPDEVAWMCAQCGQGLILDVEKGLAPLEIHFAAGIAQNASGKPYWVADGTVTNLRRETYGSSSAGESERFWSQPHRFFVPAFSSTLENLLSQGTSLLLQPPGLQPGSPARFEPVILPVEDIAPTAEFIVMAIEAARKDKVKKLDFTLQLSPAILWILP